MNGHVALLGDSILDNIAYTSGGPDVVTQLQSMLPSAGGRRFWPWMAAWLGTS
jgi:hypothetical protein